MSFLARFATAVALAASLFVPVSGFAGDLAGVKERGELRFAMSGSFPPFSFVNDQNQIVGFDIDIGTELAKRLGVKPVVVATAWDGIIAGLITGKYDAVIGSMTITEERRKAIDFAGPYYHSGRSVFVAESSGVKTLEDLNGKSVGVTLGETNEKWARTQKGWTVRTYKALPEILLEIRAGRVEAVVADAIPVLVTMKTNGEKLRQIDIPGLDGREEIGIAIRKNNADFKEALQKALDEMKTDGTYERISMTWIGRDIR